MRNSSHTGGRRWNKCTLLRVADIPVGGSSTSTSLGCVSLHVYLNNDNFGRLVAGFSFQTVVFSTAVAQENNCYCQNDKYAEDELYY